MRKKLAILGSTGSVGLKCLDVVDQHPENFEIKFLSAGRKIDLIQQQIKKYTPESIAINDEKSLIELKERVNIPDVLFSSELNALYDLINRGDIDLVVNALPSIYGYQASYQTLKSGTDLALANKESLLLAGPILNSAAKENNATIIPIDSEASAIFQCLHGEVELKVNKIYLTASGGPLYKSGIDSRTATKKDVLKHPIWEMGPKISVDSATMMNKAFEVYELNQLFGIDIDKIEVLIHTESIVHSMIEFNDGQIKALLSAPDMSFPVSYALNFPERGENPISQVDFTTLSLNFEALKKGQFPIFDLALDFLKKDGRNAAALVVANDYLVQKYLDDSISFSEIHSMLNLILLKMENRNLNSLKDIEQYVKDCQEICTQLFK